MFYFTLMQLIHYLGYLVIDDCENPLNQGLAYANFVHIAFQPLFYLVGLYGLFRVYKIVTARQLVSLRYFAYLAAIAGVMSVMRVFPMQYPLKTEGCAFCGPPCTRTGKQHIAPTVPLRTRPYYVTPGVFFHFLLIFGPPLLYNNVTRGIALVTYASAAAPDFLYDVTTAEAAALWCGIAIAQMAATTLIALYNRGR